MTPATRGRAAIASRVCVVSSLTLSCSNTALVIRRDTSSCTAGSFASGATMARYLDSSSSVDRDQLARADSGASRAATRSSTMAPAHRPRPGRLGRGRAGSHPLRQGLGGGDLGAQALELGAFVAGEGTRGRRRRVPGSSVVSRPGARVRVASALAPAWLRRRLGHGVGRRLGLGRGGAAVGSAWGWARWACCSWSSSSGGPVRHPDAVGRGGPRQAPRQFPTVGRIAWRLVTQRG